MAHVAESQHWYAKDGAPVYEVPYADPSRGQRPATLRDARKLDLVPGFTEISKTLAAPGLEHWKREQILLAALTLPRIEGESTDEFIARVRVDADEHGREAREVGTEIHAAVQACFEGAAVDPRYAVHAQSARTALAEEFGHDVEWQCETPFASQLGFGGKVDIHAPGLVGDFKTKDFDKDKLPRPFVEQAMQLAAYRAGLGMDDAVCFNAYVARDSGLVHIHVWSEDKLRAEFEVFKHTLAIWRARKDYYP
jgi:hypothetical protein